MNKTEKLINEFEKISGLSVFYVNKPKDFYIRIEGNGRILFEEKLPTKMANRLLQGLIAGYKIAKEE